ncbi:Phosphoribosyltransferase [Candidatus Accumulibacter aalborgensis]|uniref:Phosphoribosyltransferase n=1 Tax=Candidatus Accumulibacter aalborgensis TaxID=1860102 RepID=A0A1A8XLJ0_9PROT|nr:hypoxanthine-guanine phosphoribosyltransferase [Candidatus Accumulibacter aalborgensis]SBT05536.1 Phosphoribosyltransferase [Candidatus Accumulibacter aalborgensis]
MIDPQQAMAILASAEMIHSADAVSAAVSRVAREINERFRDSNPLLLCVMNGGVPFAGHLMTQLSFPLDFDHVHVGRYGQATSGGELCWRSEPSVSVSGRTVLVVDDILDEGLTLAAIRDRLLQLGADACYTVVLTDKMNGREKPIQADFVALTVPDRFLFGYGMDVGGAWRNLPAIYAMRED